MMPYNPPSYAKMLEAVGLRKSKDLLAYWSTPNKVNDAKVERVADRDVARLVGVAVQLVRVAREVVQLAPAGAVLHP